MPSKAAQDAARYVLMDKASGAILRDMETHRTKLRRLLPSDFEKIRELESNSEIMRFIPARVPQTEQQTRERLQSQIEKQASLEPFGIWVAEEKTSGAFVGWFMLMPKDKKLELGFMLVQSQWGKGFATEIGKELARFAKEKGISELYAATDLNNPSSIRVLERIGFRFSEKTKAPDKFAAGGEVDLNAYCLKL